MAIATTANRHRGVRRARVRRRASWPGRRPATKDAALTRLAALLRERTDDVLAANAADLADERAEALTEALRDRLTLTPERVEAMAAGVDAIVALPDPVGEEIDAAHFAAASRCASCGCRSALSP